MMRTYKVQRMTADNFDRYMSGGYNYHVETVTVVAETPEDAVEMAKAEEYVVNEDSVMTIEEALAKEQANARRHAEYEAAEVMRKVNRILREARKAEAAGMTVEEYKREQNRKRNIRRVENEIAALENELMYLREKLARMKRV